MVLGQVHPSSPEIKSPSAPLQCSRQESNSASKQPSEEHQKIDMAHIGCILRIAQVPPNITPQIIRALLDKVGTVKRLYLKPEDAVKTLARAEDAGTRKSVRYTEGWIEFSSMNEALYALKTLNGTSMNTGLKHAARSGLARFTWRLEHVPGLHWVDISADRTARSREKEDIIRTEVGVLSEKNDAYLASKELKNDDSDTSSFVRQKALYLDSGNIDCLIGLL